MPHGGIETTRSANTTCVEIPRTVALQRRRREYIFLFLLQDYRDVLLSINSPPPHPLQRAFRSVGGMGGTRRRIPVRMFQRNYVS